VRTLGLLIALSACASSRTLRAPSSSCFPVAFDHIYFKTDAASFERIGKSHVFSENGFAFFEPHKKPRGTYEGHYITGQEHYLEILPEKTPFANQAIGIGFISEKVGCVNAIESMLKKSLPSGFTRAPDESWGSFMDHKSNGLWVWVFESTPAYVGKGESIARRDYLRAIRSKNGDQTPEYDFVRFREVRIALPDRDLATLSRVFAALGWKTVALNVFESKGTRIVLENSSLRPRLVSLELQTVSTTASSAKHVMGSLEVFRTGDSLRLINTARPPYDDGQKPPAEKTAPGASAHPKS
jgi:hypothetical protein